jgi:hypothetical protein
MDKTSNFLALLREPVAQMYAWAARRAPNSIGKNLTVIVVGQNGGRPVGLSSSYRVELTRDPELKPVTELVDGQLFLSGGEAVKQFVTEAMKSTPPDAQLIRRVIAFDAASRPREVGGSIAIPEVDRASARWIEAGFCQPLDPTLWR